MPGAGSSDQEVEELELAFGDLSLTVRRRRTTAPASARSTASTSSFTVVPPQPEPDLGPHSVFIRRLHAAGEPWTARARIARAVRAGVAAAAVLRGETEYVCRSPALPLLNRIYIVLRSGCTPESFVTTSYSKYFSKLSDPATGKFRTGTLSHGFASKAEAESYCAAAGQPWPAKLLESN